MESPGQMYLKTRGDGGSSASALATAASHSGVLHWLRSSECLPYSLIYCPGRHLHVAQWIQQDGCCCLAQGKGDTP